MKKIRCLIFALISFGSVNGQPAASWSDGGKYVGELKSGNKKKGERHGQGTHTYATGSRYVGEWKDDKRHGQGTYTFGPGKLKGDKYVGEWKRGKEHGQGTYTYANGDKYVGEWKRGKEHGQGTYTFANGDKYVGEWEYGYKPREGTFTYANGDSYVGEFTMYGKPSGRGAYTYANGEKFVELCSKFRYGQRTYTSANGEKYVGEICRGVKHGQGTLTYPSASEYVGAWWDDEKHGQGTYTFGPGKLKGDKYVGEWKRGKEHGQGTFTYSNGDKYVGRVLGGPWGLGTYTYANGDEYVGEFKRGVPQGQGTYTYANGDEYVGRFIFGVPQGQGTYTFINGDRYEGRFPIRSDSCGALFLNDGTVHNCFKLKANEKLEVGIVRFKDELVLEKKRARQKEEAKKLAKREEKKKQRLKKEREKKLYSVSSGTGFAVSNNGHIITNNHVTSGCQEVKLHTKDRAVKAKVINRDSVNDIALIKANFKPKHIFSLKRDNPKLLEDVFVGGYPFGRALSSSVKGTKGVVSSLAGLGNNYSQIQIDAPLQPGNSGGPIIDTKGQVIGVAVAKLDLKKILKNFGTLPDDVNFGIKSNVVYNFLSSNQVKAKTNPPKNVTRDVIAKQITDGTYLLSCWMTMAQVEKLKERKVMFEELQ